AFDLVVGRGVRLSRIVAHSAAGPFPQESVLTHRQPSDGLCRPRWGRSSVSTKQATASLARVRFVMSERRPPGHRTRHVPGRAGSGTTLGLRELKWHPPRCARPHRAIAPLRAPAPEANAQCEWSEFRRVRLRRNSRYAISRNTSFPPPGRSSSQLWQPYPSDSDYHSCDLDIR